MKRRYDPDVDHAKTRLTLKGIKTLFFFGVSINYSRNLAFVRGGGASCNLTPASENRRMSVFWGCYYNMSTDEKVLKYWRKISSLHYMVHVLQI